jgi:hypothetical protein
MEDNQDVAEDEYYSDDPVLSPKIDWFAKFKSFAPIVTLLFVTTFFLPNTVGGRINISSGISNIEFGKGLIQAPTCAQGQQLSLSLSAKFDNSNNKFLLSHPTDSSARKLLLEQVDDNCRYLHHFFSLPRST